jgi:hypothetical protein
MDLGEFKLKNLSYELRYDPAFLVMDRLGAIVAEFTRRWSDFKVVEQNRSSLKLRATHMEMLIGIERSHVVHAGLKLSEENVIEQASMLTELLADAGAVDAFNRVGTRQQHHRVFALLEEAVEAFYGTGIVPRPPAKNFGVEGKPHFADFTQRVEGEALGWLFKFAVQTATHMLQPAFGDDTDSVLREEHGDAYFSFFAPPGSIILTTNAKDHVPLAAALGKIVQAP